MSEGQDEQGRDIDAGSELIEPDLYLACDPDEGSAFAAAMKELIGG